MPQDLDYILVLTPPGLHKANIEEAMKTGLPIVVEKPLAGNHEDVAELDKMLRDYKAPVYCIDWEVMHAMPLLAAAGINVPFTDALETKNPQCFREFDFKNIVSIDGRFVEGGENSLGDIDYVKKHRPWLFDYCQGGGMLYDLAVHPLNVLAAMGFRSSGLGDVKLGTSIREGVDDAGKPIYKKGVYQRFGKMPPGEKTGEIYGRADMAMQLDGSGPDIPTVIEVAKGAAVNDGRIVLVDVKGNKMQWEMFPLDEHGQRIAGSRLRMFDSKGEEVASSTLKADCYALIAEDIARFMDSQRKLQGNTKLYFPEHRDMITAVADMHDFARSRHIEPNETVTQLALESPDRAPRAAGFQKRDPLAPDGTGPTRTASGGNGN